jgi:hypothetical protein
MVQYCCYVIGLLITGVLFSAGNAKICNWRNNDELIQFFPVVGMTLQDCKESCLDEVKTRHPVVDTEANNHQYSNENEDQEVFYCCWFNPHKGKCFMVKNRTTSANKERLADFKTVQEIQNGDEFNLQ